MGRRTICAAANGGDNYEVHEKNTVITVLTIEMTAECRISRVRIVRTPDKLPSSLPAIP